MGWDPVGLVKKKKRLSYHHCVVFIFLTLILTTTNDDNSTCVRTMTRSKEKKWNRFAGVFLTDRDLTPTLISVHLNTHYHEGKMAFNLLQSQLYPPTIQLGEEIT